MINEKGQTLIEWLVVSFVLFFIFFAIVEIIRLQSFKANLQDISNYYANYISLYQYKFINNDRFNIDSQDKKIIELKIKKQMNLFIIINYFRFNHKKNSLKIFNYIILLNPSLQ